MNTHHMKYFFDAATHLSLQRAAEVNHVTHSAVSLSIRTLEKELGVELLEHARRKFILTVEGERVRDQFGVWLKKLEDLKAELSVSSPEPSGDLKVIGAQSLITTSVAEALIRYRAKVPKVRVHLSAGPAAQVHAALLAEAADLGILVDHHKLTGCSSKTIAKGKFVLVKRPSSKLSLNDGVIVTSANKVEVEHLARAIRKKSKQRREIKIEMEVMSWTLIKDFVSRTSAIGYVPDYMVHEELRSGKLVTLPNPGEPFEYEIKAAWKKDRPLRRNASLFLETLLGS